MSQEVTAVKANITCECPVCVRGRRYDAIRAGGDVEEMAGLIDEMHDLLCETEEDLEWNKMQVQELLAKLNPAPVPIPSPAS